MIGLCPVKVEPRDFYLVPTLFDALEFGEDNKIFLVIGREYQKESQVLVRETFCEVSDKGD
ncbi:MAG: hypothetical protein ACUVQ6_05795 [Dissulfurimicrobium sp.]|uniref:hypothetical protein n=1 Tax=Dissulfurimicrobium sp. TaxID=2022436 RepID=UPI0040492570